MSWNCGWGKLGHASCKISPLRQILFPCQLKLVNIKTFHNTEVNQATLMFFGTLPDLKQWCLSFTGKKLQEEKKLNNDMIGRWFGKQQNTHIGQIS